MLIYATEEDIVRCMTIVKRELENEKVNFTEAKLREITIDVMSISYAKGGDYSDKVIKGFLEGYISHKLYKKILTE
jgi:hypothetical protein